MIIHRSKNTLTNIFWGILNKFINMLFPFIIRTVIIYSLGAQYLGLNSLFTSLLQMLNLTELGLSGAIVYSMYEPIAKNDNETICALLKVYKKIYRIMGIVILIIGLSLIPFLENFIKGDYPSDIHLIPLYLIYLFNTVLGYFFFSYKSSLLTAHHRNDIISNSNSIIIFIQSIIQIFIIFFLKNYYFYIIVMPLFTLFNNILIARITNKLFPHLICKGSISKSLANDIKQRVKGLFVTRICTTSRNALDSIFISSLVGLTDVAIYGNYYYIMGAIVSLLNILTSSMAAGIGNSIITESIEKNYNDMIKFDFLFMWISGFCTICLLCLYQPFMYLWTGSDMMYSMDIVIIFCLYFYGLALGSIRAVYHDAAGLWWEARYRAIFELIMNIILNIVLTIHLGVFGTILGTFLSMMIINYGYGASIVFKYYFKNYSIKNYYINHLRYTLATLIIAIITFFITNLVPIGGISGLIIKLLLCIVIINIGYFICYRKNKLFILNIAHLKELSNRR